MSVSLDPTSIRPAITPLVATALYLWLAITTIGAIVWLVRRRRSQRATALPASAKTSLVASATDEPPRWQADSTTPEHATAGDASNEGQPVFAASTAAAVVADQSPPTGADHMKAPANVEAMPPAMHQPRTLAEMLEGIELPYDLTPIPSAVEDPDRHLIFLTTHSNPAEVGTKFADELIRLGFGFEPLADNQAIAERGDDVVSMLLVPAANQVDTGFGPRYGAAGRGDVALELWVGNSSTPPVVF